MYLPLSRPDFGAIYLKEQERKRAEEAERFANGGPAKPKPLPVLPKSLPVLPKSFVAASSTATVRPISPLQIEQNKLSSIQQQVVTNQPKLNPTGYVPQSVKEGFHRAQAQKELEDKALNVAEKATYALPIPVVGEAIAGAGMGVYAGIHGARAIRNVSKGDYKSAAINAGSAAIGVGVGSLLGRVGAITQTAFRPTYATGVAQAEADAGAAWARDWFKGRAVAGMGGLTPADAAISQAIKRPVVADPATWKALGHSSNTDGVYTPVLNSSVVSPMATEPRSIAVHEATHQYQNAMKGSPAMQQGLNQLRRETPNREYMTSGYSKYFAKPIEQHSRLMELRHALNYRPDEFITKERFLKDVADYKSKHTDWHNPVWNFDWGGLWKDHTVNWLNNVPSVALPVAGAGVFGGGALSGIPKRTGER